MAGPQLTFRELHYFMAVVTQRGFIRASELIHVSQPTLSLGIRSLEEKLGVRLFERGRKSASLTEKGRIFLRHAERLLEDERTLYRAVSDETGPLTGTVKLALPPALGAIYFQPVIRQFCKLYPDVILDIGEYPSDRLAAQLLGHHINITALIEPVHDRQIRTIPFAEEELCLLMADTHPLAGQATCSLAELTEERLVLLSEDFKINQFINEAFARHGAAPHVTGRTSDTSLLLAMVQAGMGVTIIPASLHRPAPNDGLHCCTLTDPALRISIALAIRRNSPLSKAEDAWLHCCLGTSTHAPPSPAMQGRAGRGGKA